MRRRGTLIFALILVLASRDSAAEPLSVNSPDGKLSVTFELKSNPQPYLAGERAYYRVSYRGSPLLADSPLGLDFYESSALDRDFEVVNTNRRSHNEIWETVVGARKKIPDNYNELTVALRERVPPRRRVDVIFRAYNEGVAFRYFLPQQSGMEKFALAAENTGFYFARDASAFALNMGRMNTNNEGEYLRVRLYEIKPSSIINLPLLVEIPGGPWLALLEADLTDYAGMYVSGVPGIDNALVSLLSRPPRRVDSGWNLSWREYLWKDQPVTGTTPKAIPWRVLMVAPTPTRLIETNYLNMNLNPPCALADTSWVKPGKTSLFWWVGQYPYPTKFKAGENMETLRHFVDFSSEYKFEYALIDDGWSTHEDVTRALPGISIPDLVEYARTKGVEILLWAPWKPVDKQMDEAFALYEKWGVAGVKVDFMDRDDQWMVNFYDRVVKKAAEHHLLVDFHGAFKPTGLRRTYPNLITREGVMGIEYSLWSNWATPEHDVTIPFTRMVAGPMDYAPGAFRNVTRSEFKPGKIESVSQGTRAHQLALYVVYESPLQMVWGYPESYENQPGMEFLEKVPTTWDETRVLSGEVGKHIVIARRIGDNWYLGALTNWDEREMSIPLDFLGTGDFDAQLFADGTDANTDATSLKITAARASAKGNMKVHLASGGGLAAILRPAQD